MLADAVRIPVPQQGFWTKGIAESLNWPRVHKVPRLSPAAKLDLVAEEFNSGRITTSQALRALDFPDPDDAFDALTWSAAMANRVHPPGFSGSPSPGDRFECMYGFREDRGFPVPSGSELEFRNKHSTLVLECYSVLERGRQPWFAYIRPIDRRAYLRPMQSPGFPVGASQAMNSAPQRLMPFPDDVPDPGPPPRAAPRCECGGDSVGSGHSTWCPKA